MTTALTARQPVHDAIGARLNTLGSARLTVFADGEVPAAPPVTAGRVSPYAVVWGAAARPDLNPNLSATVGGPSLAGDTLLVGQITFAAGYLDDLLAVLDEAIPLLHLWTPTVPGLSCGRLRQRPGLEPGTPRRDDNVRPPRFFTPWQWELHVTTSSTP